jgi:redox-sensitive bicupin YhaK (pirin superfamily)
MRLTARWLLILSNASLLADAYASARYGQFVMKRSGEIRQAMIDDQSGRFGEIG